MVFDSGFLTFYQSFFMFFFFFNGFDSLSIVIFDGRQWFCFPFLMEKRF